MQKLNQVLLNPDNCIGANLNDWFSRSGGKALRKALKYKEFSQDGIISEIEASGLKGMGGSGFPTHIKWRAISSQKSKNKYLICNGNEDEPGTFKDRRLIKNTPHQLIEGTLIAALACGISNIIFYLNPNMHDEIKIFHLAIKQWIGCNLYSQLAEQIKLSNSNTLEIKIVVSSGHYVGGEETAAIAHIEGNFAFPRIRPPYPMESGINGNPTLINNIETLCNIPHIIRNGSRWYRHLGIDKAYGTKIFSLSGDVLNAGIYELPMGTSLRELIFRYGGGIPNRKKVIAVFIGGPSNTLFTKKNLNVALDFDSVSKHNFKLGTGAIIVVSNRRDIINKVSEYLDFFSQESCGQCPACKSGTYHMSTSLRKIRQGNGTPSDLKQLMDLCQILPKSGKCSLIDSAVNVLNSSLKYFLDDYQKLLRKE